MLCEQAPPPLHVLYIANMEKQIVTHRRRGLLGSYTDLCCSHDAAKPRHPVSTLQLKFSQVLAVQQMSALNEKTLPVEVGVIHHPPQPENGDSLRTGENAALLFKDRNDSVHHVDTFFRDYEHCQGKENYLHLRE